MTVAPSPATSGVDFHIDHATTYFFNSFEQTVPFKATVYPANELPTKQNSEIILVQAYTPGTRLGTITLAELFGGKSAPGSAQVAETQAGDAALGQSEVQSLSVTATSGTYTLSFGGQTTASINWNDGASTIQTRLRALSSIGSGNVNVAGSGPFTVTFAGSLANLPQSLVTADASLLVYGGAGTVAVVEVTHGGVAVNEVQTVTVNGQSGTYTLSFGGQTTGPLTPGLSPDSLATELQLLSSIGSGNVAVAGSPGAYTVTFQGTLGGAAQALITADVTLLALAGQNEVISLSVDADAGTFRLSADGGSNYTAALAQNASAATVQTALRGLAAIGAGNCVVMYDSNAAAYLVTFVGGKATTAMALTVDAASLTVVTAHVTACLRAQDNTTARTIVVGDHVEAAKLDDYPQISGTLVGGTTTNDWAPSGYASAGQVLCTVSGAGGATLTGFQGGSAGRRLVISAAGTGHVTSPLILPHESNLSTDGNRFWLRDQVPVSLNAGDSIEFIYDPSPYGIAPFTHTISWREIGRAISPLAFLAATTAPNYGATVTPDASQGEWQTVTVTNNSAVTIAAATNPPTSGETQQLVIEISNTSGGAMGAITWDASYVFPGLTFTKPANNKKRYARFMWNGSEFVCTSVAAADYA